MNIKRRMPIPPSPFSGDLQDDLDRVFALWGAALARNGGPWLFGERSIADAFFAPVVTRLRTYAIPTPDFCAPYCQTMLADTDLQDWESAALAETWSIEQTDRLYT